ncbi:hypothetical protein Tco_1546146 [Tanacetum coccineum]
MAAGSRDRPPMLATGRYAQWRSRFLRYIDTRPDGDALRKCILKGPYTPTIVTTPAVPATEDSPAVPEQTTVETVTNMTPENIAHFESEKEAIHLILTGIGDEIYSTVDACQTAQEMWEAIERLQQGESLNIQDVKTNLFWEFGQFTSHDGETIESYYTRFYKMMNEMIRNNLTVATMQVNVQFLQQLQPEWSRFVTIVKQQHKLDEVSYHKLFDILKQYQKEVNELRAERMAKNANPLALVATAQTLQDPYYLPIIKEQSDWLADTDEEIDEQELEAHYSYMEKIQEVPNADSGIDAEPLEQDDQNDVECDYERVALANLNANLKLHVDENKKIQKQLKKANATLTQELTECKSILAKTSRTLREYNRLLAQKEIDIKEGLKVKAYEISVVKEKHDELVKQSLLTKSHYEGLVKEKTKVITDLKLKEEKDIDKMISMENQLKFLNLSKSISKSRQAYNVMTNNINHLKEIIDQAWVNHSNDRLYLRNLTAQDMEILVKTCLMPLALKTQNDSFAFVHELKQEMHVDLKYVESLEDEIDELGI